jgi:hypothetical protein
VDCIFEEYDALVLLRLPYHLAALLNDRASHRKRYSAVADHVVPVTQAQARQEDCRVGSDREPQAGGVPAHAGRHFARDSDLRDLFQVTVPNELDDGGEFLLCGACGRVHALVRLRALAGDGEVLRVWRDLYFVWDNAYLLAGQLCTS